MIKKYLFILVIKRMNKIFINYILFFLIIIIFITIIYFLINKKKNEKSLLFSGEMYSKYIESFNVKENGNETCNSFFNKNSFCAYDLDTQKCGCRFQKDDLRYLFDSPADCCERLCNNLSKDECLKNSEETKMPYYCNIGGNCVEYKGTIISSHIAANYCGNDPLNNQLLLPYSSKENCMKNVDVCDKYNIPTRSKNVNKDECLKDINCGYCNNQYGGGKCISGTASGPNDLRKYYYCTPGNLTGKDKYEYGNHVAYLLQK